MAAGSNRAQRHCRGFIYDQAREGASLLVQHAYVFKLLLVGEPAAALDKDILRSHEGGQWNDPLKRPLLANTYMRQVFDMLFLELEGVAVLDFVVDILLLGQYLAHRAVRPEAIVILQDEYVIQSLRDLRERQIVIHEPGVNLMYGGHFGLGAKDQNHPVGLQAFMLAGFQGYLDGANLVDQHPEQAKAGRVRRLTNKQVTCLYCDHVGDHSVEPVFVLMSM